MYLHGVKFLSAVFHEIDGSANESLAFMVFKFVAWLRLPEVEAMVLCPIQLALAVFSVSKMDLG